MIRPHATKGHPHIIESSGMIETWRDGRLFLTCTTDVALAERLTDERVAAGDMGLRLEGEVPPS